MNEAFPAIVKMMMLSQDAEALQNGSECLRIYVSKAAPQLVAWTDGTATGIQYVAHLFHGETYAVNAAFGMRSRTLMGCTASRVRARAIRGVQIDGEFL